MSNPVETARALIALADACRNVVENMSGEEMDKWYEENVGYRPTEDDPTIGPVELTVKVAGAMFFGGLPEGVDTPYAEAVERDMEQRIRTGIQDDEKRNELLSMLSVEHYMMTGELTAADGSKRTTH